MRFSRLLCALIVGLTYVTSVGCSAQERNRTAELFQRLQRPETSGQAAAELINLGRTDPATRQYLAEHLPALIGTNPQQGDVMRLEWFSSVQVAGELKISETVSALAKLIGFSTSHGVTGLSRDASLRECPAALALVKIGDPAVPTLQHLLERRDWSSRRQAMFVLIQINSPKAEEALRKYGLR